MDIYDRIAVLSPAKRQLLAQQLAEDRRKQLVAYTVAPFGQPSNQELRDFLKGRLPEFMVPTTFVALDALPTTPNGKVDRRALPVPDDIWPEFGDVYVAPSTPTEETLAQIWADVLRVEQVGVHDNFFELGGDSILSIQIVARASRAGLQLVPDQLFDYQSIAELATVATTVADEQAAPATVDGEMPLTPIQHWFFEQNWPDKHHWNQSVLLEVDATLTADLLASAVQVLVSHHDALRIQLTYAEGAWQQRYTKQDVSLKRINLSAQPATAQPALLEREAAQLQSSFDLASGGLVRAAFFEMGVGQPNRLLLILHHLVVDGVSWRVLLEDFQTSCEQLKRGEPVVLPPKTSSFQQWAKALVEVADSAEWQAQLPYWQAVPTAAAAELPTDFEGRNCVASARVISAELSPQETQQLLFEAPATYNTQINDLLLTALAQTCAQWRGTLDLLIGLESHGREALTADIELSRSVGWLTSFFPVRLGLPSASGQGEAIKSIKEQLRGIPKRGIGYGVLRYLNVRTGQQLAALPMQQLLFNYLGQSDSILSGDDSYFQMAHESAGPMQSSVGQRHHVLEINAQVIAGRLRLDWTYSPNLHSAATIETLSETYLSKLRDLIAHCLSQETGGYTPSDFPEIAVDQAGLDDVLSEIMLGLGN